MVIVGVSHVVNQAAWTLAEQGKHNQKGQEESCCLAPKWLGRQYGQDVEVGGEGGDQYSGQHPEGGSIDGSSKSPFKEMPEGACFQPAPEQVADQEKRGRPGPVAHE